MSVSHATGVNGETFYSVRRPNGQLLSGWKNELLKAIVKDYSNSRDPINP